MEKNNDNNLQQFLTQKRTLAPITSEPWTKLEVSFLLIQSYNDLVSLFFLLLTQASPPFNWSLRFFTPSSWREVKPTLKLSHHLVWKQQEKWCMEGGFLVSTLQSIGVTFKTLVTMRSKSTFKNWFPRLFLSSQSHTVLSNSWLLP